MHARVIGPIQLCELCSDWAALTYVEELAAGLNSCTAAQGWAWPLGVEGVSDGFKLLA